MVGGRTACGFPCVFERCYGNLLVADAKIIGSPGCVQGFREAAPSHKHLLPRAAAVVGA
jgi:hypothetical protein